MNYSDPNLGMLATEIEYGNCAVFVGAGVSIPSGLPSWSQLGETMRAAARLSNNYGNLRVADCCRQVLGGRTFASLMEAEVNKATEPSAIHRRIAGLPVNIFATTNYDIHLESALREAKKVEPRVLSLDDTTAWLYLPDHPSEPWVMKLHGCIRRTRDRLVISEEDFLSFSACYPNIVQGMREVLARHPVLFIGYSLSDWDLLNILYNLRHQMGEDIPNRYFVGFDLELPERRFLEQRYGLRIFDLADDAARTPPANPGLPVRGNQGEEIFADKTGAVIRFLDRVVDRFRVPPWLRACITELGGHVRARPGLIDEPLASLFPGFDVTVMMRLVVRVQWLRGIALPMERLASHDVTIGEFVDLVHRAETR